MRKRILLMLAVFAATEAWADEPLSDLIPPDAKVRLASAEADYRTELASCAGALIDELVGLEMRVLSDKKLRIEERADRICDLRIQQERFLNQGLRLELAWNSAASERYDNGVERARANVETELDRLAQEYLAQKLDTIVAAVVEEKNRVLAASAFERPEGRVASGIDTNLISEFSALLMANALPSPLPNHIQPHARFIIAAAKDLTRIREAFRASLDECNDALLRAYDDRESSIRASLKPEVALAQIAALYKEREALMAANGDGEFPSWSAVLAMQHRKRWTKAVEAARTGSDALAVDALPKLAELALAILDVRDRCFVARTPTARPEVQPDRSVPEESPVAFGTELLKNPGCEIDPSRVQSGVADWETCEGEWYRRGMLENELDPPPFDGSFFFSPLKGVDMPLAQLAQDVDVTRYAALIDGDSVDIEFSGQIASLPQKNPDQGQITLEFRTRSDEWISEWASPYVSSRAQWTRVHCREPIPKGTRIIRVWLEAKRRGRAVNNAYFDALSLKIEQRSQ